LHCVRYLILCATLCLLPPVCAGQTSDCKLTVDDAPEIRGLKLRMAKKDVIALYPAISLERDYSGNSIPITPGTFGESSVRFHTIIYGIYDKRGAEKLRGVDRVELRFLDGRLSHIEIHYDDSTTWDSVDSFARKIGDTMGLPPVWQEARNAEERFIECQGFRVTASLLSRPSISFSDSVVPQIIKQRQKEEEQKARESFKP